MDFIEATRHAAAAGTIRRAGWHTPVVLIDGWFHYDIPAAPPSSRRYGPTAADVLATDWEVVA